MKKKREEAVKIAQEKAEQEQTEIATKKREAEKFSIRQQMKVFVVKIVYYSCFVSILCQLEEEARGKIEREKQEEREKAMEELEQWKGHKQKETEEDKTKQLQSQHKQNSKLSHNMWQDNKDIPGQ